MPKKSLDDRQDKLDRTFEVAISNNPGEVSATETDEGRRRVLHDGVSEKTYEKIMDAEGVWGRWREIPFLRRQSTNGTVLNLSMGAVFSAPIRFSVKVGNEGQWNLIVAIGNSDALFLNEIEHAKVHDLNAKQILGYNPYSFAETAQIGVSYPDVDKDSAYSLQEAGSQFFYRDLSSFLSLIQRRRILILGVRLVSSGVISTPPFAAAENMDANAFGEPMFPGQQLQHVISMFAAWHDQNAHEDSDQIYGAMARMSALLNLPYAYERAEGYWRILEALGSELPDTEKSKALYEQAKAQIGTKKSHNLEIMLRAAAIALPPERIDLENIALAFHFRNEITHEFLNEPLEAHTRAPKVMPVLQELCERFILKRLNIECENYIKPAYNIIFGRVM